MTLALTVLGQTREREELVALLSLVLLAGGVVLGLLALGRPRLPRLLVGAVLGAGAAAWTLSNTPYEGAVLYRASSSNGLTAADVLVLLPAAVLLLLLRHDRRRGSQA